MTRRSKNITRVPLKLGDSVYTLTSKKNKQKNDVMKIDKEGISDDYGENCSGSNDDCDVIKEDSGETKKQRNEVENDQVTDDLSVKLRIINGTNMSQQSKVMQNEGEMAYLGIRNRQLVNEMNETESGKKSEIKNEVRGGKQGADLNMNSKQSSFYAKMVSNDVNDLDKKLFFVPTGMNDNGDEAIIFDEELVEERCQKWKNNMCGYFVRCNMSIYEMRYSFRRIKGRHGLGEIIVYYNEICFFKFKNAEGNKGSIEVVKKALKDFSQVYSRVSNLGKSIIFFGSIKERDKIDRLLVMPFKCGKLPVRYLGIPLLAKKLVVNDCKVLIDRVESRINNWRNKTLSYARRIQLIAYVLSCMQMYWASVFFLPITIINALEKLLKRFLWNAGDSKKGKTRFWKIIENKDSLWAKWVNVVKLKNRNIWDVIVDKCDSWGWKTMLKIRDDIREHVWFEIGNGRKTSVWYDKWCKDGPLSSAISKRDIYEAILHDEARVADIINNGQWIWPDGWMDKYPFLANLDRTINLNESEDKVLWITNADQKVCFFYKAGMEGLENKLARSELETYCLVQSINHKESFYSLNGYSR
ncbi:hypothetical protein Tco_0251417 [Tanacetum coccineum]